MSVVPSELHFLPDWKLTEGPASMLMVVILALKNEDRLISILELRTLDLSTVTPRIVEYLEVVASTKEQAI